MAQLPSQAEVDRPTQRWLPLPQGDAIDLSEQAQLLQQLRELISSESESRTGSTPLPKLSEQQLLDMEKALESMRELFGEDKLPNLESIPKEWIDQALSDPVLRKQAQQLLEQYARDRKLPLPSDRKLRNGNVPFPQKQPTDGSNQNPNKASNQKSNSSPKPKSPTELFPPIDDPFANAPNSNAAPPNATGSDEALTDQSQTDHQGNGQVPNGQERNTQGRDNQASSDRGRDRAPNPNGTRNKSTDDELPSNSKLEQSSQSPLPTRPDAERIEALQELFKKLKAIEGQRPQDKSLPNKNGGSARTTPIQPNTNTTNSGRPTKPSSSRGQLDPVMPQRNGDGTKPPTLRSEAAPNQSAQPRNAQRSTDTQADPPTSVAGKDPSNNLTQLPPDFENTNPDNLGSKQGSQPKSKIAESQKTQSSRTRSQGSTSTEKSSSLDRLRSSSPPKDNTQPSGNANGSSPSDADIKTQLERDGLGRALQSIVEKTMKEQGESNPASTQPATKRPTAQSKKQNNSTASNATPQASSPTSPASNATPNRPAPQSPDALSKSNGASSVPSSANQNPSGPSTMSGLREMAAQFWGAIRSTPTDTSSGSSSGSPSLSGGVGEFEFVWNGRMLLVLGLVLVLVTTLLLLARKRSVLATATKEAEAELAKVILTEGIRTRADVVRAFHRFVLRRASPVANWWNHRYVATRLTEASPQLRSVISDLASVYEHARYLPPEVPLSSDEINRVQAALKQCAASGV